MKRIYKTPGPNKLTRYCDRFPNNKWEQFRNSGKSRKNYKSIKDRVFEDQGQLCAYCEISLKETDPSEKRLEHYRSKKHSSSNYNIDLDWNNIIGVCLGGNNYRLKYPQVDWENVRKSKIKKDYLTCDSHKDMLESNGELDSSIDGYALNPLVIIESPSLFNFNKVTGDLEPNPDVCASFEVDHNIYGSVFELVEKTIEIFNLNAKRLCDERLLIFKDYNKKVEICRSKRIKNHKEVIAKLWFSNKWPEYFTVRRILVGQAAEELINKSDC